VRVGVGPVDDEAVSATDLHDPGREPAAVVRREPFLGVLAAFAVALTAIDLLPRVRPHIDDRE